MVAWHNSLDSRDPRRNMPPPVVWSLPVMVLLVYVSMRFNDWFYGYWVNFDAQSDAQQQEKLHTTRIFQYTSGVLCGQFLALLAGIGLGRRHTHAIALAVAVPLACVLAGVTLLTAYPLAQAHESAYFTTSPFDDPVLVRALVRELAAYPLYAAAGVGVGVLLGRRWPRGRWRGFLAALLVVGWGVATMIGLLQDDRFGPPLFLLWTVPPIAAGTAIALSGLSIDVWHEPPVLVGDWGSSASIALLASAAAYALVLNLIGVLITARRRRPPHP